MPTRRKRTSRPAARKKAAKPVKGRAPARSHLLIVECDSATLARDGLNLGAPFGELLTKIFPEKRIAVVRTSTEAKLGEDLAAALKEYGRFRSVLLVGHSNASGLVLTGDGLRSWGAVGKWLEPFGPEFCFLAACKAGKSEAVRGLFAPVGTLKQVYASPAVLRKNQLSPLAVIIGMLLKDGRINEDQSGALRLVNYVLTGGQLYRWRRADTGPGEEARSALLDGLSTLLDRGSWDLLERMFPSVRPQNGGHLPA